MKVSPVLALALALAGGARADPAQTPHAQTAPTQTSPNQTAAEPAAPTPLSGVTVIARRPTHLSGVTVTATNWCPEPDPARHPADRAPRVVDSFPAPGGVTPPGYVQVRVSFDAPMSCYSEVMVDGPGEPCEPAGTWMLPDRQSWMMSCRLEPGTAYRMRFARRDGRGFVGLSGREAQPYELDFTTSQGPPTATREAAARLDPGLAGGRLASAYVTCADEKGVERGRDCSHQRLGPPRPPP